MTELKKLEQNFTGTGNRQRAAGICDRIGMYELTDPAVKAALLRHLGRGRQTRRRISPTRRHRHAMDMQKPLPGAKRRQGQVLYLNEKVAPRPQPERQSVT